MIGILKMLLWRGMIVELSNNEIWKILDALEAYKKDYAISGAVENY